MNNQFKSGDLALIVGFNKSPVNLGKACELIAFMQPGERIDYQHGDFGGFRHTGTQPGWLVSGDGLISSSGNAGHTLVLQNNLMPLRGDFAPELQKSQEVPA